MNRFLITIAIGVYPILMAIYCIWVFACWLMDWTVLIGDLFNLSPFLLFLCFFGSKSYGYCLNHRLMTIGIAVWYFMGFFYLVIPFFNYIVFLLLIIIIYGFIRSLSTFIYQIETWKRKITV